MKKIAVIFIFFITIILTSCAHKHEHIYSNNYHNDSEGHWFECFCGLVTDANRHSFNEGEVIKSPTYYKDGEIKYTCTECSYTKIEVISKAEAFGIKVNIVDSVSFSDSIILNLSLEDNNELYNKFDLDIKMSIISQDSSTVISTKSLSFSRNLNVQVNFSGLKSEKEYILHCYFEFNDEIIYLFERNVMLEEVGTFNKPYEISSYSDFVNILKRNNDAYYKLVDDIDFEGNSITPLFTSTTPFEGVFDGNGKTIRNFKVVEKDENGNNKHVSSSSQYYGLFGYIGSEGEIRNLILDSFEVYVSRSTSLSSSKQSNYGLLAGYCAGTVKNVTVTNSTLNVKSTNKTSNLIVVGGLVGNLAGKGILNNVRVNADVTFDGVLDVTLGGVVGSTVNAERMSKVENDATVNISNIYRASYTGDINVKLEGTTCSAVTAVGGLIGKNYSALVVDCSSTGTITINSEFSKVASQTITLGGLVGWMVSDNAVLSVSRSTITFDVTTLDVPTYENVLNVYAGLLVGQNGGSASSKSMVTDCQYELIEGTNTINVSASEAVVVTSDLVANQLGYLGNSNVHSTATILVKEYTVVSEGESIIEKEYTLIFSNSD